MKNDIDIKKLQSAVCDLVNKYEIEFVVLFGSRVGVKIYFGSDTDIAVKSIRVLSPKEIAEIAYKLASVVPRGKIDIVDLRQAPPLLLRDVAQSGILLYEKKESLFEHFRIYALKRFMETAPLRKLRHISIDNFLMQKA